MTDDPPQSVGSQSERLSLKNTSTQLDEDQIRERVHAASDASIPGRLACDVTPRAVNWLWTGYLPLGKPAEIIGDAGQGKSLLIAQLAASITTGAAFPDGSKPAVVGNVIIISAEDDDEDTLRPRLEAAGADLAKVRLVTQRDSLPVLPNEVSKLRHWIIADKAVAVFFDPLDAFLDAKIDANTNSSMRRVSSPISKIARETGAVIIFIRHLNKDSKTTNALYRAGGSVGITAAARASFLVASDPSDPNSHVFAWTKGNLAKRADSLGYQIAEASIVGPYGEIIKTQRIQWTGVVNHSARDLLREPEPGKRGPEPEQLEAAKELIRKFLADRMEHPSKELEEIAAGAAISHPTMIEARRRLGVRARSRGFNPKQWLLWLPPNSDSTEQDAQNRQPDLDFTKSQDSSQNCDADSTANPDSTSFNENSDSTIKALGENKFFDSDHRRVGVSEALDAGDEEIEVEL
jgi:hypothetical protein